MDTAHGSGEAFNVTVESRMHWPHVWLEIADEQLLLATAARAAIDAGDGSKLTAEFRASLLAIVASACAVEAADKAESKPRTAGPHKNEGDKISRRHHLPTQVRTALHALFDTRNATLHPRSVQQPLAPHPHPVIGNTSIEVVERSLEQAAHARQVAGAAVGAILG